MGFTITNKIFCRQTKRENLLKKIGRLTVDSTRKKKHRGDMGKPWQP